MSNDVRRHFNFMEKTGHKSKNSQYLFNLTIYDQIQQKRII